MARPHPSTKNGPATVPPATVWPGTSRPYDNPSPHFQCFWLCTRPECRVSASHAPDGEEIRVHCPPRRYPERNDEKRHSRRIASIHAQGQRSRPHGSERTQLQPHRWGLGARESRKEPGREPEGAPFPGSEGPGVRMNLGLPPRRLSAPRPLTAGARTALGLGPQPRCVRRGTGMPANFRIPPIPQETTMCPDGRRTTVSRLKSLPAVRNTGQAPKCQEHTHGFKTSCERPG